MDQNKLAVLFFATLRERVGTKQTQVELPSGATVRDLKDFLVIQYPGLDQAMRTCIVAVNRQYAKDEEILPVGAEIAIFPPVSGGSENPTEQKWPTIFAITDELLDVDALLAQITLPTTGAACLFTGMVRAFTHRGDPFETEYLEYEAYKPMAEAKMHQVADEIRLRWPAVEGIAIVQRIGHLLPGTPTVLIACSASHRDTGVFEAARYGIDRLKEIVPIWKKEVGPMGEVWIEGKYTPSPDE